MAITGQGLASKEQVAGMLKRLLNIKEEELTPLWMQQMHWLLHIVISCSLTPQLQAIHIEVGKIL